MTFVARLALALVLAGKTRAVVVCSLSGGCFDRHAATLTSEKTAESAKLKSNWTGGYHQPMQIPGYIATTTIPLHWNGTTHGRPGAISAPAACMWSSVIITLLVAVAFSQKMKGFAEDNPPFNKYLAEFVGTYLLVFSYGANKIVGDQVWCVTSIACTVMALVYALGNAADANLNPAISLAMGLSERLSGARVVVSMCLQFAAAIAGGLTYGLLFGETFNLLPAPGHHWWQAALAELLYTFVICFVFLSTAALKTQGKKEYYGLAIGFTIIAGGYGAGGISGGYFNPAIAFAVDSSSSALGPGYFAAYFICEILGAVIAAIMFRLCRPGEFVPVAPNKSAETATDASAGTDDDSGVGVPLGVRVTITNKQSRRSLYAQQGKDGMEGFGATSAKIWLPEAVWCIERCPDDKSRFRIINYSSERALYAKRDCDEEEEVGAASVSSNAHAEDSFWELIKDEDGEGFMIVNQQTHRTLYAEEGKDWATGVGARFGTVGNRADAVWCIQREDTGSVELISEFLGTYILVLTFGLNVLTDSRAKEWSIAASLICMVYALTSCSAVHFNPAVTLAVWCSGREKISVENTVYYMVAQFGGAACAAFTFMLVMNGKSAPLMPAHVASTKAILGELTFTFLLCFVFLAVATTEKKLSHYFGLAIGGCVVAGGYAMGSISGGVLNPAASFGLAFSGCMKGGPIEHFLSFAVVQFLGGAAAAMLFFSTHASEFAPKED